MTISFTPLRQHDNHYGLVDVPEERELNLSNANGLNLLDASGTDDACPDEPWPIQYFRALVTVARRKRLGHLSPAIATSVDKECGRVPSSTAAAPKDISSTSSKPCPIC